MGGILGFLLGIGPLVNTIGGVLKSLGIIKENLTPEQQTQIKMALIQAGADEKSEAHKAFAAFIQATSPTGVVGAWANTLYTIVRNAGVIYIMWAIAHPALGTALVATITGLAGAGLPGVLVLTIPLWEYFGDDVINMLPWAKVTTTGPDKILKGGY